MVFDQLERDETLSCTRGVDNSGFAGEVKHDRRLLIGAAVVCEQVKTHAVSPPPSRLSQNTHFVHL